MTGLLTTLAGLVFVLGYIPYISSILKGETKPAKASWIIWGLLDTITFAGMLAAGTLNGQIIGALIGVWIVIMLAFRYGVPGWTVLDKLCLAGAALGLILWGVTRNPVVAIVVSNAVVFLGSFPTFVSAWSHPERENKTAWALYWISCVLALFAIPRWTLGDAAQPVTFLVIESVMMMLLFIRPRKP